MECGKLKKKAVIIAMLAIILMAMLAGCISTDTSRVDGTIYNNTDYKVNVHAQNKATGAIGRWGINGNSTRPVTLNVASYTILAYYWDDDSLIGTDDLQVRASDATFSIIIYNETVYCDAY